MTLKKIIIPLLTLLCTTTAHGQTIGIKTNLLYGATTLTPNIGAEIALNEKMTIELAGGYNWWNRTAGNNDNKKLVHWLAEIEARYWICNKFNGWFVGAHTLGSQFNISGHNLPLLFEKGSQEYRYQGYAMGAGLSVGYQFILSRRWNIELSAGGGYALLNYDKYQCRTCGTIIEENKSKNYWGPTKASVSIMFLL